MIVTFERQLKEIQGKVNKALNILRYMNRVSWGMEVNTALMIYKSYVRSLIEYGLMIYYPKYWKGRDILDKLQNRSLRIAMGYRNSAPIIVMMAKTQVLRLEDRANFLARNIWTKTIVYDE